MIAHRSLDPPCDPIARKTLPRPPHPAPNVRDDRETPLLVGRDNGSCRCDLGGTKTEIFLQTGLDRKIETTPDGQISAIGGRRDETLRYQVKQEGCSLVSRTRRSVLRCSAEPDPCQIRCTVTVTRVSLGCSPALSPYPGRLARMADHDPSE